MGKENERPQQTIPRIPRQLNVCSRLFFNRITVVGKVARIAGQQRIVVEISGLCLVATAYIPTDIIKIVK